MRLFMIALVASFVCLAGCKQHIVDDPTLSPLMNAARGNDLKRAKMLIQHGADVRQRMSQGKTALYESIERRIGEDNLPMVRLLLDSGVDPNEREIFDQHVLDISMSRDYANPEVTLLLLERGAQVEHSCPHDGDGEVSAATMESSVAVIHELLSRGAPANCQFHGMTALHWAALNGQTERIRVLLAGGADAHLKNVDGRTPLDLATTTNPEPRVQSDFEKTREILQRAQ